MRRKSHYRDYAVAAFRLYAEQGPAAAYKERIREQAETASREDGMPSRGLGSPTEAAVIRAEQALDNVQAVLADMEAVERVLDRAARRKDGEIMREALRKVYLVAGPAEWGEIERRVCAASMAIPADRSTVFQALARACVMFAEERGLRI